MQNVEGKVVVITGASSGLGEATARLLARHGAKLALGARRADRIHALVEELTTASHAAIGVATDVTQREQVKALVDAAVATFGHVDVMVNNAGVMPLSLLESVKVDEWDQMIDINLKGVLYGIAAVLPHMIPRKSGQVINVSSTAGHRVSPSTAVYSATKHAVRALSEGFRQEMTPHNIRSTIISPGASSTELQSGITDKAIAEKLKSAGHASLSPDAFANLVLFAISQPEEIDINEILYRPTAQQA